MTIPNTASTNINSFHTQIAAPQKAVTATITAPPQEAKQPKDEFKPTFFDQISAKVVNPRDISDMVKVPRCIFKGYLGIMFGTTFITLGMMAQKHKTLSTALSIIGLGLSSVGTFEFVKPFMLKAKKEEEKKI